MNCRTKTDIGFVVLGYNPDGWGPSGQSDRLARKYSENFALVGLFFTPLHEDVGGRPQSCLAGAGLGAGNSENCCPGYPLGPARGITEGRTGKVVQKLRGHEGLS
jgi:hypothetical protein